MQYILTGVNLTILGAKRGEPEFPHDFVHVIISNNIKIVETCGGGIDLMSKLHKLLREGGVKVFCYGYQSTQFASIVYSK